MRALRHEVFQTANAYRVAAQQYCRAARLHENLEAPTQELLGRSIFYGDALRKLRDASTGEVSEDAARRLRALTTSIHELSRRYRG